ncbi:ABC transporter ATP-binding protein [Amycolatopsis alba]|uniref:ABC transporter ATP-binding protein n=1 Tax=Amycolatopsis alba TaxID=76020 RepID=UPI00037F91DA|nr:ABC transporter ATP-binding protein [Amycolatopsis alba]
MEPVLSRADLVRSACYAVRLAWQADRGGVLVVLGAQLATSAGLGAALLLLGELLTGLTKLGLPDSGTDLGQVVPAILVLVVLGTAGASLGTWSGARQQILMDRVDRHVIGQVLHTAGHAELPHFEDPEFHDRLTRAIYAARNEPATVVVTLAAVLQAILATLAVAGALWTMAWWLLPLMLLSVLPVIKTAADKRKELYGLHHDLSEDRRRREYLEMLLTSRDEAKEIRALDLAGHLRERWASAYEAELGSTVRLIRTHLRRQLLAKLVSSLLVCGVVSLVWWFVTIGLLQLATAAAGIAGVWLLAGRLEQAGIMLNHAGEALVFLKDLSTFGAQIAVREADLPGTKAAVRTLTAEDLHFTYPGAGKPALRGVDITLRQGEVVALVGPNGSGKTTLAKLLAGLYEPSSGKVCGDGRPVRDLAELRRNCAVVFQDFVRYKLSVADNIRFGRVGDPGEAHLVAEAAHAAGAAEFVSELPQDYETLLGREFTGGTDLSGGQWQKLAIARSFYRNAPIVILDEPTAALDPQAERELSERIRELFAGRAVLLVSHRFSNVRSADRIYVMDRGRVREHGSHETLMNAEGMYASLFLAQAGGYRE